MKNNFNFAIQWHITNRCINRCKHCYMYNDDYRPEDVSYEEFTRYLNNIEKFESKYNVNIRSVYLTGGSALLHPEFERIIRFLHDQGRRIEIMDIPEMVNEESLELLEKYGINGMQMSLDGLPDTHDEIRGKGSFDRTINACRLMASKGMLPRIMFTLHEKNMNELMPLTKLLDAALDRFTFTFDLLVCEGNGKELAANLSPKQIRELLNEYACFAKSFNNTHQTKRFFFKPTLYHILDFYNKKEVASLTQEYAMVSGCLIGWNTITVLPNGDVMPCRRLGIRIGNLGTDSFEQLFLENELMRKFRRYNEYMDGCGDCGYSIFCRGCPAQTHGLTGDFFGAYPYCDMKKPIKASGYRFPPIDIGNDEEMQLVFDTMNNVLLRNPEKMLYRPNVIKTLHLTRVDSQNISIIFRGIDEWYEKTRIKLAYDEREFIIRLLSLKNKGETNHENGS